MVYSPLITASIFASVVTVLVLINIPKQQSNDKKQNSFFVIVLKAFIMSFLVCGVVAYVLHDNDTNNMMTNILKSHPDF